MISATLPRYITPTASIRSPRRVTGTATLTTDRGGSQRQSFDLVVDSSQNISRQVRQYVRQAIGADWLVDRRDWQVTEDLF